MASTTVAPLRPHPISLTSVVRSLDARCADLWACEPVVSPTERSDVLRELSDVDHDVLVLALQLSSDEPTGPDLARRVNECERRLRRLERRWGRTAA